MSAILQSASVMRVREALAAAGVAAEIVELPGAARTARQAADFLGCDVAQIANSLVFRSARDKPLLVMSSGARRIVPAFVKLTVTYSLTLSKGARDRAGEEATLDAVLLNGLANLAGVGEQLPLSLLPGEDLQIESLPGAGVTSRGR